MVLGDRPVRVTLARSWAALGRWERVRFVWTLLRSGCFVPHEALRESVESMKVWDSLVSSHQTPVSSSWGTAPCTAEWAQHTGLTSMSSTGSLMPSRLCMLHACCLHAPALRACQRKTDDMDAGVACRLRVQNGMQQP